MTTRTDLARELERAANSGTRFSNEVVGRIVRNNLQAILTALTTPTNDEVRDDGWQDISTAPRDGTVISLTSTSPLWKYPFPARWSEKLMWWEFADYPLNDIWAVSELVSHWRPLPPPPAMPEPREIAEKEDEARKHLSPLERQKAAYRPLQSIDEILGLERERLAVRAVLEGNSK